MRASSTWTTCPSRTAWRSELDGNSVFRFAFCFFGMLPGSHNGVGQSLRRRQGRLARELAPPKFCLTSARTCACSAAHETASRQGRQWLSSATRSLLLLVLFVPRAMCASPRTSKHKTASRHTCNERRGVDRDVNPVRGQLDARGCRTGGRDRLLALQLRSAACRGMEGCRWHQTRSQRTAVERGGAEEHVIITWPGG